MTATRELREGDQREVGTLAFEMLHTPGHTEGSVCLYEPTHRLLLAGDVLFAGSFGRTDLPGGNDAAMVASLARLARDLQTRCGCCPATARRPRSGGSGPGWSASRPRADC